MICPFRWPFPSKSNRFARVLLAFWIAAAASNHTLGDDQLRIRDICRLKGQETNTLQGYGLVVGLKGTGDEASKPTKRSLARLYQLMGGNISADAVGQPNIDELVETKNVASVFITVELPPHGAQPGDEIDCKISAIGAKSLEGGTLMLTPLVGPRVDQPVTFALAEGQVVIPNRSIPTSGKITRGCKMERVVKNEFVENGRITLIVDSDISSFSTAQAIEDEINSLNRSAGLTSRTSQSNVEPSPIARAIDAKHIEVAIPKYWQESPVKFVSEILDRPLRYLQNNKRVVINERDGVVVVGEDVLIMPVAISHKNLSIEAKGTPGDFIGLDTVNPGPPQAKLKELTDTLNTLDVPTEDIIAIIKTLKAQGVLLGELVTQ